MYEAIVPSEGWQGNHSLTGGRVSLLISDIDQIKIYRSYSYDCNKLL
jgi:hypothetical protein